MTGGDKILGRYEIVRKLTAGGMGEILLARQTGAAGFDRHVVLKSILPEHASDPDVLDQFLNEARIMGCINHPNVVAVYEVGEHEGTYFMVMEYVDGVDLAEIVTAAAEVGRALSPRFVASVGRDAALGLDFAHHAKDSNGNPLGVIHRDVTPHNVMVRRDGVVKLVDFGVARAVNRRKKTEAGVLKGKLGYFAPEQIAEEDVDARADQFVLGIVLWELITGRRAFPGENTGLVLKRISGDRLPRASTLCLVAQELDDIIYKMTALSPADRYERLNHAAEALNAFVGRAAGDAGEVALTVKALFGDSLDARAQDLHHEAVPLEGRTLTMPKTAIPAAAAATATTAPKRRDRQAVIDLERASEAPVSLAGGNRARESSFREFELDLGAAGAEPLEVGRTGRFKNEGSDALPKAEDELDLDETARQVEEPARDEITVVWCDVAGALDRERLLPALRHIAAEAGASFAAVGSALVCILGAARPKNSYPERGVRLACELVGLIEDATATTATTTTTATTAGNASSSASVVRAGVATGMSPAGATRAGRVSPRCRTAPWIARGGWRARRCPGA